MRRHNAFTLMELLVVIAIMASLIAILVPTLSKSRKAVKRVTCTTNQRTLLHLYKSYESPKPYPQSDESILVEDVLKAGKAMFCPEATTIRTERGLGDAFTAWKLNLVGTPTMVDGSYGANGWFTIFLYPTGLGHYYNRQVPLDEPAIPVFVDAVLAQVAPRDTDAIPAVPLTPQEAEYFVPAVQTSAIANRRHGSMTNVAFWDGHVESVKLPDLWTLKWTRDWKRDTPYPIPDSWAGNVSP